MSKTGSSAGPCGPSMSSLQDDPLWMTTIGTQSWGHSNKLSRTLVPRLVEQHYWWPGMRKEIMAFVQGCTDCQQNKVNNRPINASLQPIYPKPEALPFETIVLDFITKLPESQGSDTILTITDHDCTKAVVFIPCREEIMAEETAALYLKHVFLCYGLPSRIISNHDPCFTSKFT